MTLSSHAGSGEAIDASGADDSIDAQFETLRVAEPQRAGVLAWLRIERLRVQHGRVGVQRDVGFLVEVAVADAR